MSLLYASSRPYTKDVSCYRELLFREMGRLPPAIVSRRNVARMLDGFGLSDTKEVESKHTAPIHTIDIDQVECRYLLSGSADARMAIYDLTEQINTGDRRGDHLQAKPMHRINDWETLHQYSVTCVQWYPFDTGMFVSGSADCTVKVWDTNDLRVAQEFRLQDHVNVCQMSSTATTHALIAAGTAGHHVRLCDLASGAFSHSLIGHKSEIWAVCWSPVNEFVLATGSMDTTIRIWDIRRPGALMLFDQHNFVSPFINKAYIDAKDQSSVRHVQSHNGVVTHLAYSPDGQWIMSSGTDGRLRRWDALTGKNTLVNYASAQNRRRINRFALSHDASVAFFPNPDLSILMLDVATGREEKKLMGHMDKVNSVVYHPHREELYSAGDDRMILVWTPRPKITEEEDQPVIEEEEMIRRGGLALSEYRQRDLPLPPSLQPHSPLADEFSDMPGLEPTHLLPSQSLELKRQFEGDRFGLDLRQDGLRHQQRKRSRSSGQNVNRRSDDEDSEDGDNWSDDESGLPLDFSILDDNKQERKARAREEQGGRGRGRGRARARAKAKASTSISERGRGGSGGGRGSDGRGGGGGSGGDREGGNNVRSSDVEPSAFQARGRGRGGGRGRGRGRGQG